MCATSEPDALQSKLQLSDDESPSPPSHERATPDPEMVVVSDKIHLNTGVLASSPDACTRMCATSEPDALQSKLLVAARQNNGDARSPWSLWHATAIAVV